MKAVTCCAQAESNYIGFPKGSACLLEDQDSSTSLSEDSSLSLIAVAKNNNANKNSTSSAEESTSSSGKCNIHEDEEGGSSGRTEVTSGDCGCFGTSENILSCYTLL